MGKIENNTEWISKSAINGLLMIRGGFFFYFRRGGNGCTVIYNVRSRGDTLSLRLCAIAVNLVPKDSICFLV